MDANAVRMQLGRLAKLEIAHPWRPSPRTAEGIPVGMFGKAGEITVLLSWNTQTRVPDRQNNLKIAEAFSDFHLLWLDTVSIITLEVFSGVRFEITQNEVKSKLPPEGIFDNLPSVIAKPDGSNRLVDDEIRRTIHLWVIEEVYKKVKEKSAKSEFPVFAILDLEALQKELEPKEEKPKREAEAEAEAEVATEAPQKQE